VSKLIEHARLGQGKRAPQQPFVQHADLLGIESIEAPHGFDALIERDLGHGYHPPPENHACDVGAVAANVPHILDEVNLL
jgi:hypothetical protein